ATPVALPKGTTLKMRFTYDNSAGNPRNPHQPPQPVMYGLQSSDEMCELWFQVLARNDADRQRLADEYETKMARLFREHDVYLLRKDPNDPDAHEDLGLAMLGEGKLAEAEQHLRKAIQAKPDFGH